MFRRAYLLALYTIKTIYHALVTEKFLLRKDTYWIPRVVGGKVSLPQVQRIPRIIHQTHETPEQNKDIYMLTKQLINVNHTYEYRFYDALDREKYIFNNYGATSTVLKAYYKLAHGTARADLFRLAVLYIDGGVYLDTKSSAVEPFDTFIPADSEFVSLQDSMKHSIATGSLIGCTPNNALMKIILDKAVANILEGKYGANPLDVAGPNTAGKIIEELGKGPISMGRYKIDGTIVDIVGRAMFFRNYSVGRTGDPILVRCPTDYYTSLRLMLSRYEVSWLCGSYFVN
jgi:hypothetical protein